jgi:hypothetical protein
MNKQAALEQLTSSDRVSFARRRRPSLPHLSLPVFIRKGGHVVAESLAFALANAAREANECTAATAGGWIEKGDARSSVRKGK